MLTFVASFLQMAGTARAAADAGRLCSEEEDDEADDVDPMLVASLVSPSVCWPDDASSWFRDSGGCGSSYTNSGRTRLSMACLRCHAPEESCCSRTERR